MRRVAQHDLGEPDGALGRIDRAAESLLDQARKIADMVHVGMGEHDGVDGLGVGREWLPVLFAQALGSLEHPGVHEDAAMAALGQQIFRAGDRPGCPQEGQ
ncbi:hypothetical protein SDC9_151860 [bioreactor metagenome]|uniref:Uncharacterized protein n=1 Tax=bioreactor metagenome TaxID=1076179 RepID=A0A645ET61_9ZZZZ